MATNTDLPIGVSALPVSDWLDLLSELPPAIAGKQLNQTLQQLRAGSVNADILLPILIALTPAALDLWQKLALLDIKSRPLNPEQNAESPSRLAVQIIKQLSVLYFRITDSGSELTPDKMESACFFALQVAGHCQCCLATFHEAPSETLWKKTAELYRLAAKNLWMERIQAINCNDMSLTPSILTTLRRNILFTITSPRRYQDTEPLQLFAFANRYHDLIDLEECFPSPGFCYYWSVSGEEPCPVRQFNATLPKGYIAINTSRLGNSLMQHHLQTSLSPTTEAQITLKFSAYLELFQNLSPGASILSRIVTGLNDIIAFVQDMDKRNNIQQLSFGELQFSSRLDDLSLVPIDSGRPQQDEPPINPFGPTQGGGTGKIAHVYKTLNDKYLIAEGQLLGCLTGDLVLIHNQHQREMRLAIVRQQLPHGITRSPHSLFETLSGSLSPHMFNSGLGKQHCLIVSELDSTEIFLPAGKYQTDTKIVLNTGKAIFLKQCIEANSYFARFKLA